LKTKEIERHVIGINVKNSTITENTKAIWQFRGKALWTALATLIDGEGCISMQLSKSGNSNRYHPNITVGGTCVEWIKAWQERIGRGQLYCYENRDRKWKVEAFWKLTNRADIVYILKRVLPYLIVKREQAELVISFYKDKLSVKTTHLPEQELARRAAIYDRMRKLNAKGNPERLYVEHPQVDGDIVRPVEPSTETGDNVLLN
jgi:hypothetical protein